MEYHPIIGHPTYGVSKCGKVFCFRKEKEIIPFLSIDGYMRVYLTNKEGTLAYFVHRLVAKTFLTQVEGKFEVDHIDRNRTNNNISNLRWADDYDQALNTQGKGVKVGHKFIHYEIVGNHECYMIQINNRTLKFKKRFDSRKYKLDDVIKERNEILKKYNIPITD